MIPIITNIDSEKLRVFRPKLWGPERQSPELTELKKIDSRKQFKLRSFSSDDLRDGLGAGANRKTDRLFTGRILFLSHTQSLISFSHVVPKITSIRATVPHPS